MCSTPPGETIGCDAGMCCLTFHATCRNTCYVRSAQREGLLSEASSDVEIADPFYAHCKQHADKAGLKVKRRNYLAMQSAIKTFNDVQETVNRQEKVQHHNS